MKKLKEHLSRFIKPIWNDSVGSKLIASSIIYIVIAIIPPLVDGFKKGGKFNEVALLIWNYKVPIWIVFIVFLVLLLIWSFPKNKEAKKTSPLSKMIFSLLDASNADFYHKKVEYKIILQEVLGNKVWIQLEFQQHSINLTNNSYQKPIEFPLFNRRTKLAEGSINGENYNFNGSLNHATNRNYQMECNVLPNESLNVNFSVWIEYDINDSELFQTYRCCEKFIFSYEDRVSIISKKDCFDFYCHSMHDYIGIDGQIKYSPTNKFKGRIALDKGLLPYQGIYFKWNML
ncbi:MAG: hypothetical protein AAGF96_00195 [Bacteroidota bacterium]